MPLMHGPAFDKNGEATGKMVEREVSDNDTHAYQAVGYKLGPLPEPEPEEEKPKTKK
jgi:hypothetical protein